MNLVLIGYRGTGKSAVGRYVARALGREAVSLDEEIVRVAGMRIPDIVARFGWPHFRDIESQTVQAVAARDGLVIDTGGGVVERAENVTCLKANGCVVWLDASVDTVLERIKDGQERPALSAGKTFTEEVAEIMARRRPLYAAAADLRVETPSGDGTVEAVGRAVLTALSGKELGEERKEER